MIHLMVNIQHKNDNKIVSLVMGRSILREWDARRVFFTSEKNDNRSLLEGIRVCVKGEKCTWLLSGLFQLR